MNRNKVALVLGLVCLILTIAISIQIKTINGTNSEVSSSFGEDDLRDEVLKWKEKYDKEAQNLTEVDKQLAKIREQLSKNDSTSSSKEEQIRTNNMLLGLTDLIGKGIELTVKDDPSITTQTIGIYDDISNHIVHDGDLRRIVNELKNAGAEAICINEQRIVSSSAITCIGNVIKINDEKVSSPFTIKAIGFPERMESALTRAGGYLDWLDDYGIVTTVKKTDSVKIPKYTGVINSKYMK